MSLEESRSFEYFQIRTIPQLSGYFKSPFWSRYVLRTAIEEPSIRHAVIALGSLHERFEAGDPSVLKSNLDRLEGGFALQQYIKAIGKLIGPLSHENHQSLDIALTACVLFICFEVYGIFSYVNCLLISHRRYEPIMVQHSVTYLAVQNFCRK